MAQNGSQGPSGAQYERPLYTTRGIFMRPQLHPDMGQVVICARVARQLTAMYYRYDQLAGETAATCASRAALHLPPDYLGMFRFALHSLSVYLVLGMPSHVWLQNVLEASHFGHSFRRCFFFDYKEQRRAYPRVTNRGVQTSSKAAGARVKKGKVNA